MDFEKSNFSKLPPEIIEQILVNLCAIDIIAFLEAYPYCSQIPANFTNLDLSNRYELVDLNRFFEKRYFQPENIRTLNVNNIYWIAADDLRNFIIQLVDLRNLYAIQTQLSITEEDIIVYNCTRLKKLAVTYHFDSSESQCIRLSTLRALYLYCPVITPTKDSIEALINKVFINAKSIWLCEFVNMKRHSYRLQTEDLKKSRYSSTNFLDLGNLFKNNTIKSRDPHWNKLVKYDGFDSIFYHKDIELITSRQIQFDFTHLQELALINIKSDQNTDKIELIKLTQQILLTPQVKRLRKLAVYSCFLYVTDKNVIKDESLIGQSIFQNLDGLQVLEISNHDHCFRTLLFPHVFAEYKFIAQCKHLKRLKIEFGRCYTEFLADVLKECTLIEQLVLVFDCGSEENLFASKVPTAIGFAKNLQDFTYINPNIDLNEFNCVLHELCSKNLKNLKRMVISHPDEFNFMRRDEVIEKFLNHYSQLVFFHLNSQVLSIGAKTIHPNLFDLMYDQNTVASSTRIQDFYQCTD